MSNIAIIPARGGSKRIPRKNIKDFLGKPIIAYSIHVALKSELFDEVMVSTDDEEIADIARKYEAKVPFMRSKKNANDFATTVDVINEVLNNYAEQENRKFDYSCCIYPTAPLIQTKHLEEGYYLLKSKGYDSVFPVVDFSYPIWRGLEIDEHGKTKMIWPDYLNSRSQDLKKVYHDAGQWYWFNINKIKDKLFTENSGSIILSDLEVQDIDTDIDWKLAELKFKIINQGC